MDPAASKYNATVESVERLNPDLFILKVRPDRVVEPFVSGQYVLLGLSTNVPRREGSEPEFKEQKPDRLVLRAYSIASGGHETEVLEFYISVVANGSLTPRLVTVRPGDRLNMGDKIRGHFTLDTVSEGHDTVLLASTGTGLAPYISMLRAQHVNPRPYRLIVLHGSRVSSDLGYREEMERHARELPGVLYIPSVSRPQLDPDWKGDTGRITRYFDTPELQERYGFTLDPAKTSVFLCGNPEMISAVENVLTPLGYTKHTTSEPGALHIEEYW